MQLLCRWWKISVGRFSVGAWWSLYLSKRQWANTKEEISISSQLWKTWDNQNIHGGCLDSSFGEKTVSCQSLSVLLSCTDYLQRAGHSLGVYLLIHWLWCGTHYSLLSPAWRLCQCWASPTPSSDPPSCGMTCPTSSEASSAADGWVWWVPRVIWWRSSVPASSWPALLFSHANIINNG